MGEPPGGGSTLSFAVKAVIASRSTNPRCIAAADTPSPLARPGRDYIGNLAQAPSRQPTNALRMPRSVAASYAPQADTAPRLLAALQPAAAPSLYQAWSSLAAPAGRVNVYAARVKAGLFAGNWVGPATVTSGTTVTTSSSRTRISRSCRHWATALWGGFRHKGVPELPLDATFDQIQPGSWVAVVRPNANPPPNNTP